MNTRNFLITEDDVRLVNRLKPKHRRILSYNGRKYKDIAAELNLPVGTVRSRLNRARNELDRLRAESPRLPEHDRELIKGIVSRAMDMERRYNDQELFEKERRLQWTLTLLVAHESCPLRLEELLNADDFNFIHDVFGIAKHLNVETRQIERFLPRFARKKEMNDVVPA